MHPFPTGTVTMFFSDIEGSTQLLKHVGEGYGDLLVIRVAKQNRLHNEEKIS